jgi:uncharacterized protein YtpQ (UPF0354 family)
MLKPTTYADAVEHQIQEARLPADAKLVLRRLTQSTVIVYAVDMPDQSTRLMVLQRDLIKWGISEEVLHETAITNLAKKSTVRINHVATQNTGTLFVIEPMNVVDSTLAIFSGTRQQENGSLVRA